MSKEITKKPSKTPSKKLWISLIAATLAVVLVVGLVLLLIPKNPALSFRGVTVSGEMYSFWFSIYKKEFMTRYGIRSSEDSPAKWESESEVKGKTWGELLDEEIDRAISMKLVAAVLYDELGFPTAAEQREIVKEYCDELVELLADGDDDAYRALCEKYGTTKRAIKKCAALDVKAELMYEYLAKRTDGGLTATEMNTFYVENYTRFKVVYFNNTVRGEMVNGERVETTLTEVERANVGVWDAALAEYLEGGAKEGQLTIEKFEEYLEKSHEEIHGESAYPDGLYVSPYINLRDVNVLEDEVVEELGYIKAGKLERVETDKGIRYIYGYPLLTAPYNNSYLEDFFLNFHSSCAAYTLARRALALIDEVEHHEENLTDISVTTVPLNLEMKFCAVVN